MAIGTQYICVKSFECLHQGWEYYFAGGRPGDRILLVHFHKRTNSWHHALFEMDREAFVRARNSAALAPTALQRSLPEWLEAVSGINFAELEDHRYPQKKISYSDAVDLRLAQIAGAASNYVDILRAPSIEKALGKHYRDDAPNSNRARYLLWFWAYVLHGFNKWALQLATHNCGTWDRLDPQHNAKKFGRPSITQTCFTFSSIGLEEQCAAAFTRHSKTSRTWTEIYEKAIAHDFGVVAILKGGVPVLVQKQNKPFPSPDQFRYRVLKSLGQDVVSRRLYGAKHSRQIAKHHEGSFGQSTRNLFERMEVDAYTLNLLPQQLDGSGPGESIHVCRGICTTSSYTTGIGFSLGAERSEAYNSMLFCCVAQRDVIERVYGMSSGTLEDLARGISPEKRSDRGAGASAGSNDPGTHLFSIEALTPSGEGQSKAFIESSNPRKRQIEGLSSRSVSKLTIPELMKKELIGLMRDNDVSDISHRLWPEATEHFLENGFTASPSNLFRYLDERACTSAVEVDFDTAVRTWCQKQQFTLSEKGVALGDRLYSSDKLKNTQFFKSTRRGGVKITGYIVPMTIRIAWIEVNGRLVEVATVPPRRSQTAELDSSLAEAKQDEANLKAVKSKSRHDRIAMKMLANQKFETETGKSWHQGGKEAVNTRKRLPRNTREKKIFTGAVSK